KNEIRLMKRCQELQSEIAANDEKIKDSLRLTQQDQTVIENLKKDIKAAWDLVDAGKDKEARAKDTIRNLNKEINALSKMIEMGDKMIAGSEDKVKALQQKKHELLLEVEGLTKQIIAIVQENTQHQEQIKKLQKEKKEF